MFQCLEIAELSHPSVSPRKRIGPTQEQRKLDQGGIRTHDLRILITVASLAELQGQNGSRPWECEIFFHGVEAGNQGERNKRLPCSTDIRILKEVFFFASKLITCFYAVK